MLVLLNLVVLYSTLPRNFRDVAVFTAALLRSFRGVVVFQVCRKTYMTLI